MRVFINPYTHVKYCCVLTQAAKPNRATLISPIHPWRGKRNSRKICGSRQYCLAGKGEVGEDKKKSNKQCKSNHSTFHRWPLPVPDCANIVQHQLHH